MVLLSTMVWPPYFDFVVGCRGTQTVDRLGSPVTQHEVAGSLAGSLAEDGLGLWSWAWRRLTGVQRPELRLCALIWQFTSTATRCQPCGGREEGCQVLKDVGWRRLWWWWW